MLKGGEYMFGERLAKLRKEKGLTQEELAKALNITRSALSLYEIGKRDPDTETLKKMAEYFGVSIDYLLGRTNLPNGFIPEEYQQKHKVTKRDINQYEETLKQLKAIFYNDKVSEEDKEKIFRDITEFFWESKERNKQKYGRKKKKE